MLPPVTVKLPVVVEYAMVYVHWLPWAVLVGPEIRANNFTGTSAAMDKKRTANTKIGLSFMVGVNSFYEKIVIDRY
jgi:hypothetical protein